jgi:hypothetical protein
MTAGLLAGILGLTLVGAMDLARGDEPIPTPAPATSERSGR